MLDAIKTPPQTGGVIVERSAYQNTNKCTVRGFNPMSIKAGPATDTQITYAAVVGTSIPKTIHANAVIINAGQSKPLEEVNVGGISNGIYVFGKKDIHLSESELDNYIFVGIDPGRNKPVSACYIDGADIPVDWNDEKRIDVLDKSISQNVFISNDEYRLLTGSKQQEEYEKCRRLGKYQEALSSFADTVCKSGVLSVTSSYYKTRLQTWHPGSLRMHFFY